MIAPRSTVKSPLTAGFTLVELSIVLVIIGLIIGGVLVGRDLINAAAVRAQISQIEKYNTAVNTFRGKYGYLPGDIPDPTATQYGFMARGAWPGQGDGNGLIEGSNCNGGCNSGNVQGGGETVMFWSDLTYANGQNINFIEGSFSSALAVIPGTAFSGTTLNLYFPKAKIGRGNYIYAWSGGRGIGSGGSPLDGINYYTLAQIVQIYNPGGGFTIANPGLTVLEAYNIDKKVDDGMPQSGNVSALYLGKARELLNDQADGRPVWVRSPKQGVEFYTGFSRAKLYEGAGKGHFRSVSIREPGQVKGTRLFHLQSILDFIARCEQAAMKEGAVAA